MTFSAVFVSTDGNGVQTWNITSDMNGAGATPTRVWPPSAPDPAHPHAFVYLLSVEPGQGTVNGDAMGTAVTLGAANAYNATFIQPGFPINPWYADNPLDSTIRQESFMLAMDAWVTANFTVTGSEKHYLTGFSKSGLGGAGLLFRNPSVFYAAMLWDAPFEMTGYDGTDPTNGGTVGGNPAAVYGTSANFTDNYELSAANLAGWAAPFTAAPQVWVGGYGSFKADTAAFPGTLTTAGIQYLAGPSWFQVHAWQTSWVWAGLSDMLAGPFSAYGRYVPSGTALTADANPYTLGGQISVSQDCTLAAVWFLSFSGAAVLPQTIGLYKVSGQLLVHSETSVTWSGAAGSGWVRAAFTSPPSLTAGTQYEVVVNQNTNANWYAGSSGSGITGFFGSGGSAPNGIVNGPLTMPSAAASAAGQQLSHASAALAYPTTTASNKTFFVDAEVTAGLPVTPVSVPPPPPPVMQNRTVTIPIRIGRR